MGSLEVMDAVSDWWKARDLPERLGPMMTKELRQGLRRGIFLGPFLGIQVLAIVAMVVEFRMVDELEQTTSFAGVLNFLLFFPGGMFSGPFWLVVGIVCVFLMPLGGLVLMGQELEEGNHELLLMTPLSRWKVVQGKFFALWGICLLTFSSLLPYVMVRYFIGGIDVGRNIALVFTVILGSGMLAAGAIGASSYRNIAARIVVLVLFLGSMAASMGAAMGGAAAREEEAGVFFTLNALGCFFCYTVLGLAMARSQIRLVVHHYEVKPSWMIIGLLFFTPFVVGMATAMTLAWAGFLGSVGMGLVAWYADTSPKAAAWVQVPEANIPVPPSLPGEGEAKGVADSEAKVAEDE
ncbi:MAG: hypothetical protein AAGC74_09500 [Verrucomicrobiota bacterium]